MTRKEAIDVLTLRKELHEETAKALDMAIEALKDKPMAKGEWIDSKTARGYVACSNCNKLTTNINRKKYNYCPFCGADVRSGVM